MHLIKWEQVPGAKDAQAQPTSEALPDFVVLVNQPDDTSQAYSQESSTFDASLLEDAATRLSARKS